MSFGARVAAAVDARASQVVLGLDPDPARVPGGAEGARAFCRRAIAAAGPACVAAKLQLASFERFGAAGWEAFERVATSAAEAGLLVIADAKRGDFDVTNRAYAEAFLRPPIDALTVNPLLGGDAMQPFLDAAASGGPGPLRAGAHVQPRRGRPPGPAARLRGALARGGGPPGRRVGRPLR